MYFALGEHIPEGKSVPQKKILALFYCGFNVVRIVRKSERFVEQGGQHFPEAVLRVHVEEAGFAAGRRGHSA